MRTAMPLATVLILIVMDNGLSPEAEFILSLSSLVLILIVMDNGLSRFTLPMVGAKAKKS